MSLGRPNSYKNNKLTNVAPKGFGALKGSIVDLVHIPRR